MGFLEISSSNKALIFLNQRIQDPNYRGQHSSQHNRYTFQVVKSILTLLDQFAPNQSLLRIRTTDISKRPLNLPEEKQYAAFCAAVKEKTGIGTQDAMRKNLLVDFHRMGLVNRYDKERNVVKAYQPGKKYYVALSDRGRRLIQEQNPLNQYFIFAKALSGMLGNVIDNLLELLRNHNLEPVSLSLCEYMFFASAIDANSTFSCTVSEAEQLILSYRLLSPIQKRACEEEVKNLLNPSRYKGNKTEKRDFHNWKNEAQQVFSLLAETPYFEQMNDILYLKTRAEFPDLQKRTDRSLSEKINYFTNHNVNKTPGYELHHLVPLSWSESVYHFKLLDCWKNMLYIDGKTHAVISQQRYNCVVLLGKGQDFILKDYSGNSVDLFYPSNVLYNPKQQTCVLEYNQKLLQIEKDTVPLKKVE